MQKLLIIVGPTASGKSALAVELAKQFDGEVISADSRQVYRGLDIGTGKVVKREMRGVPHHLLDVASPKRTYTATDFVKAAERAVKDIAKRGKLPILCGGTGFYIDAFVGSVSVPAVPPNPSRRAEMQHWSTEMLYVHLKKLDSARAETVQRTNPRRLIRAIEIAEALGSVPPQIKDRPLYDCLWIGIASERDEMRTRIETRNAAMLRRGLIAEVRRIHDAGVPWKRFDELGFEYRYAADYVRGLLTKPALLTIMNQKTWQYAKRQVTYWKRNTRINWLKPTAHLSINRKVSEWLDTIT